MAKGIGLIGNFRGKVGNMVGYNLKDSNNKQTQGVRVYQPVVKNPKTYGQAEQRAKLAPINATYRALKAIIDRGQEGKAYGNKSRLAWLSDAMKAFNGGWFEKGAAITAPAIVPLTKGSLTSIAQKTIDESGLSIAFTEVENAPTTIGALTTALLASHTELKEGDQITFVLIDSQNGTFYPAVASLVLDSTSTVGIPDVFIATATKLSMEPIFNEIWAGAIILSREGDGGQHMRTSESLKATTAYPSATVMGDAAKEAAIKSYMAAGANTDWAEESLQ